MSSIINRQWRIAKSPNPEDVISADHFSWTEEAIPEPADGEFLVRTICLGTSPAQRGYMQPVDNKFLHGLAIGEVMRGRGIGQIIASRHADYKQGEIFVGSLGWQDYSIQHPRGAQFMFSTKKLEHPIRPLSAELGVLGQAGVTAYFGLLEVGAMQAGDNVLISAAAGGVGCCVGQIARIRGAGKVIGIAGSDAKCRWLCDELGFDAAINYKAEDLQARISKLFPDGIDVFFDNVGGDILNTALGNLAMRARVIICGFISTNYTPGPHPGPINYTQVLRMRARIEGFVIFDYWERFAEAEQALMAWFKQGQLKSCEDIDAGLEKMPDTLSSLFTGGNMGVKLCRVAPDPDDLPEA